MNMSLGIYGSEHLWGTANYSSRISLFMNGKLPGNLMSPLVGHLVWIVDFFSLQMTQFLWVFLISVSDRQIDFRLTLLSINTIMFSEMIPDSFIIHLTGYGGPRMLLYPTVLGCLENNDIVSPIKLLVLIFLLFVNLLQIPWVQDPSNYTGVDLTYSVLDMMM